MHYFYNLKVVYNSFIVIFATLFFVSCGSLNSEKSLESKKENSTDKKEISSLRSELADLKDIQEGIKFEIKNKDVLLKELQDQIKVLENKIILLANNETKNMGPSDLYKKARNHVIEENYLIAAELFKDFIKKFPDNAFAGNAAYWLGECYYSLSKYKKAIAVFKNLVAKYPKSGKVPGAMLKTGYAYLSLNDSNRAHHFLKQVVRKYPFSPAAQKAQEKLKSFE